MNFGGYMKKHNSFLGFLLAATALTFAACGKKDKDTADSCDRYRNEIRDYEDRGVVGSGFDRIPTHCLPRSQRLTSTLPQQPSVNFDVSDMIVQNLQATWGNVIVLKDVQIANTGDPNVDVLAGNPTGSIAYTWLQLRDRLRVIAEHCACYVTLPSNVDSANVSLFGRLDFGAFSGQFAFDLMSSAEVRLQYDHWGYSRIRKVSHVFSYLMNAIHTSWGSVWGYWGNHNQWGWNNVYWYYIPYTIHHYHYVPYIPVYGSGNYLNVNVGISGGSNFYFDAGFSFSKYY